MGRDRNRAIASSAIDDAQETLILRRVTHLLQLATRLREDRVRRVIEPMLADGEALLEVDEDDLDYVCDLGLLREHGDRQIANPIYREIIPRQLTHVVQGSIMRRAASFVDHAGWLDVLKLMADFQSYFRQHSEAWGKQLLYKEASAQLLLHAYLRRVRDNEVTGTSQDGTRGCRSESPREKDCVWKPGKIWQASSGPHPESAGSLGSAYFRQDPSHYPPDRAQTHPAPTPQHSRAYHAIPNHSASSDPPPLDDRYYIYCQLYTKHNQAMTDLDR